MAVVLAGCPQPPRVDGTLRQCLAGGRNDYCLCRVYAQAKARCVARSDGYRWGIGAKQESVS